MQDPNLTLLAIALLGGLAIFILGMNMMTEGLNALAGSRMKALLSAFTSNRFAAAATGATITAAVQSSTVTTVLLVGFSSVGLISVAQSVGVIFGANVGSTITAQIIAFNISAAGAPLLALGLLLHLLKKRKRLSQVGLLLLGLGAIFFGMQEMSDAARPLRDYEPFIRALQTIESPLWGVAIGMVFTAAIHSSAAAIGLTIIFASQGLITLEGAIAIAFGSNIGTCVTAAIAAIGRPTAAWRIAFIHVVFNLAGVFLWYAFIPQLGELSSLIARRLLHDPSIGREIATAHTVFNLANLLLFIGFTGPISKLAAFVVPERKPRENHAATPLYLDSIFLDTPAMAIDRARLETGRLASFALRMSEDIPLAAMTSDAASLAALTSRDDELDALQTAILNYLAKIDASQLSRREQAALNEVITLANTWENVGDTLDNQIIPLGIDRANTGLEISPEMRESISKLHQELLQNMRLAMLVTSNRDPEIAQSLLGKKEAFNRLANRVEESLHQRLLGREPQRMDLFRIESDLVNNLKRIHYYVRRVAKLILATPTQTSKTTSRHPGR